MLDAIFGANKEKKKKHLSHFMGNYVEAPSDDYFAMFRLLLPNHDRERYYQMNEDALARNIVKACGLDAKGNDDAKRLKGWRKGGSGSHSGNLVEIAYNSIFLKNCGKTRGESVLTLGQINDQLDLLVKAPTADEKSKVLRALILGLSPEEMRWVLRVVLKSMHLGLSQKFIFECLHEKAEEVYNFNGMNLRNVCEKCTSRELRLDIQKVRPGHLVRPHLAKRVSSVEDAFKKMNEAEFVVETKFDGERIQLHKDGKDMRYYSRNSVEHGEYSGYCVLNEVLATQIKPDRCVLDGELIIWNKKYETFLPFGSIKSVVKALKDHKRDHVLDLLNDGLDRFHHEQEHNKHMLENVLDDTQVKLEDLEVQYIAFDVLFAEHEGEPQSVIHLPLKQRHKLLEESVLSGSGGGAVVDSNSNNGNNRKTLEVKNSGTNGKIIALLPDKCPFSQYGRDLDALQRQFDESIVRGEEGIVVKALQSLWIPDNRREEWLKLKPDYTNANEIDAIIIGGFYGTGKRGGRLSQYLLGIPRRPTQYSTSPVILSFCKVGNGLTESEQDIIHKKLEDNTAAKDHPPAHYRITGHNRETPDRWVVDPTKSVVLEVKGDIRSVPTKTFACGESLRFPVVTRIREDKGVADLTSLEEVLQVLKDTENSTSRKKRQKTAASTPTKASRGRGPSVPEEFLFTQQQSSEALQPSIRLFAGFLFYFVNCATDGESSKARMENLVVSHGGKLTQNLTNSILEGSIASERLCCVASALDWKAKMIIKKYDKDVDVASSRWIHDSLTNKKLCEYSPKYYFHLSRRTRERLGLATDGGGFDALPNQTLSSDDLSMLLLRMGSGQQADSASIDDQILASVRDSKCGKFYGCQFFLLKTTTGRSKEEECGKSKFPLQDAEQIYNVMRECQQFACQVQLSRVTESVEYLGGEVCEKWHPKINHILLAGGNLNSSSSSSSFEMPPPDVLMEQAFLGMDRSEHIEDFKQRVLTGSVSFYHLSEEEGVFKQHLPAEEAMREYLLSAEGERRAKDAAGCATAVIKEEEDIVMLEDMDMDVIVPEKKPPSKRVIIKEEQAAVKKDEGSKKRESGGDFDETVADLDDFINSFI
jgi:DNA ligase-4